MSEKPGLATEEQEQVTLIQWWAHAHKMFRLPEFALYCVPNGGWRHPGTAARLKKQGVRPGVSDLFLTVARAGFHGLYIEMKRSEDGRTSPSQREFLDFVSGEGYKAVVAEGAEEAIRAIKYYLI